MKTCPFHFIILDVCMYIRIILYSKLRKIKNIRTWGTEWLWALGKELKWEDYHPGQFRRDFLAHWMLLGQFVSVGSYEHEFSGDWEDLHDETHLEGEILICYPIYPKLEFRGRSSPAASRELDFYIQPERYKKYKEKISFWTSRVQISIHTTYIFVL